MFGVRYVLKAAWRSCSITPRLTIVSGCRGWLPVCLPGCLGCELAGPGRLPGSLVLWCCGRTRPRLPKHSKTLWKRQLRLLRHRKTRWKRRPRLLKHRKTGWKRRPRLLKHRKTRWKRRPRLLKHHKTRWKRRPRLLEHRKTRWKRQPRLQLNRICRSTCSMLGKLPGPNYIWNRWTEF